MELLKELLELQGLIEDRDYDLIVVDENDPHSEVYCSGSRTECEQWIKNNEHNHQFKDKAFSITTEDDLQEDLTEDFDATSIDVDSIKPEQKDHDRAEGFKFRKQFGRVSFNGDNSPFASEASKMAKSIKDPIKMVRRAKAVAQMYGTVKHDPYHGNAGFYTGPQRKEIWEPFVTALAKMGFTREQIKKIEDSK